MIMENNVDAFGGTKMSLKNPATLSVVATCYNGARFLPTFFKCLQSQTYQDFQLVIVNDGSTDNSLSIIKEYCKKYGNSIYLDSDNFGVATAKDRGVFLAEGKYLTFCDVDDILAPCHFENLVNTIESTGADMGVCSFRRISQKKVDKIKLNTINFAKAKTEIYNTEESLSQYFSQKKFDFVLWNKIFLMQTVRESGACFLDGTRYGEESYFIYTFLKRSTKTAYRAVKTYHYIQWKSSLMHTSFNPSRLDIYKNINAVLSDSQNNLSSISKYVCSMRAGYSCGLLYFMKKSKYNDAEWINRIIEYLKLDCKQLKKCKKTACYRKAFIPLVAPMAQLVFRKTLKGKTI